MASIAKAIQIAEEEIFIADWWLSPEVLLIRPCEDESMRLDNLLGRVAVCTQLGFTTEYEISGCFVQRTTAFVFMCCCIAKFLLLTL